MTTVAGVGMHTDPANQKWCGFARLRATASLTLLLISWTLWSCGNGSGEKSAGNSAQKIEPPGWNRLIHLENTYLLIDIPAVTIQVGRDVKQYITLTILKSNIRKGYEDQSVRRNATARILCSIRSGQQTYTEMSDRDTYVRIKIPRFDPEAEAAEIQIDARLVDTDTNSRYFEVKTAALIEGEQFKKLTDF